MYRSITTTPSNKRVFGACLLSFMILIAPIASVSAATLRSTAPSVMGKAAKTTPSQESTKNASSQPGVIERLSAFLFGPPAPPAPAITATMTDAFPSHPSGKAEPGDTITYTANVSNATGTADATAVMFDVALDANTTYVGGSLKVSPLAFPDAYTVLQDTTLNTPAATGVLLNDSGTPAPTAVPITSGSTTQLGTVTLLADGSFTYNPKAGFTGTDTFTYTATNSQAPPNATDAQAIVTITVNPPNQAPVANNDTASATEAGGTANATPGTNPSGNLVTGVGAAGSVADTDVETPTASLTVVAVRLGPEATPGASGTVGSPLAGSFGSLTLNSNGSYTYTVDNNNATVQALRTSGNTIQDIFNYTIQDTGPGTPLQDTAQFTVTIAGANDSPTDIAITAGTVAENAPINTVVGDFSTTDIDTGDTFTYTLVAGAGSTDNASFNILGNQLRTSAAFNFESTPTLSIRVRSTDAGGLFFEKQFTITVTNVNETPTDIALSPQTVGENMPSNTVVGSFTTTDPDAGDTFTYTLVGGAGSTDNASFNINGNQLQTSAIFDFETKSSYSIRVRSTDAGTLFFEKQFTITIVNNNDAPTDIALSPSSVPENSATNTVVGSFSTTDQDVGNTFTYTLVAGTGADDNASFNINAAQLRTNGPFDFETKNSYTIRVRSTDNAAAFTEKQFTITVTNVNEAPVVTTTGGSASYTEDAVPVAIDPGLTVTDPDAGATLASATIQITGNLQSAEDVLGFVNDGSTMGNIAISIPYNSGTGTLTLSSAGSTATLTNWQNALRAVTYNDTSQNPSTLARTVTFVGNDGALNSLPATKGVTVIAVNDHPVMANGGNTAAFTESGVLGANSTPVVINGGLTVTDVDSANFTGATVSITANLQANKDVLGFTNQNGISGSYDGSTGILTLTGLSTKANYQTALRSITFNSTSEDPTTGTRTVSFQVDDGGAVDNISNTITSSVTVTATNDPPTAVSYCASGCTNLALPAQAGIPISFGAGKLSGTDVAEEAANGTVVTLNTTADSTCASCIVSINANGSFTFTPPPSAAGTTVQFTYHVSDNGKPGGGVNSASATVAFVVAGPAIYFVKQAAVGANNCTLGNECTFDTAKTNIGASTNATIFLEDALTHTPGANTTLNSGGSIIGQGLVAASFDGFFGINASPGSGGTLSPRPNINQTRPTITGANAQITLNANSGVRGFNYTPSGNGLVAAGKTGLVVSEMDITSTSNTVGQFAVNFTASSSGTFTFGPISTSGGSGVNFNNTTSASTVTFGNISTGAGAGFTSAGTGTTNFTFNNVTSTTGVAVNVSTSGSGNFTFNDVTSTSGTAVSITTATGAFVFHAINANGPTKGIAVNGATGSFTVNGTTTTDGTGGTIQNATSKGAEFISSNNITLKNMNFTNNGTSQTVAGAAGTCGGNLLTGNNLSCVSQIHLQSATTVSLDNLNITGGDQMGINGNAVSAFTLANSSVSNNGNEASENGLTFQNLTGTCSITNTLILDNFAGQVAVANIANSSTLTLGVTGTRTNNAFPTQDTGTTMIGRTSVVAAGEAGILFNTLNTSTNVNMTLNLTGVVLNNNFPANAVFLNMNSASGALGGTTTNSSFDRSGGGLIIQAQNGQGGSYNVTNSEFYQSDLQSILYSGLNPFNAVMTGTVQGNIIGSAANAFSACTPPSGSNCTGIDVNQIGGTGGFQLKIGGTGGGQGNTVQQFDGNGIRIAANGDGILHAAIQNNTIQNPAGLSANGIDTNIGITAGASIDGCFNITGNTASGTFDNTPGTQLGIHTRVRFLSEHRLPGMSGTGAANAQTFLTTNNPGAAGKIFSEGNGVPGYQTGAACTTPLLLAEGGVESVLFGSLFANHALPSLGEISSIGKPCSANNPLRTILTAPSLSTTSLNQQQLDSTVTTAIARWSSTGLTPQQVTILSKVKFDVADLGDLYLGEASNNRILIDRNAGGKGWFIDPTPADDSEFGESLSTTRSYTRPMRAPAGHVDLLTAIMHELGHRLGLDDTYLSSDRDSLMYGHLTVGERRLPAKGQARTARSENSATSHFLTLASSRSDRRSQVSANNVAAKQKAPVAHAVTTTSSMLPVAPPFPVSIGTIPAGKSVRITFQVTLNTPLSPPSTSQVSAQGTVSGSNFSNVVTDDSDTGTANDATLTPVIGPPVATDDGYSAFKNTPLNIAAPGVLANDSVNTGAIFSYGVTGGEQTTIGSSTATAQGGTVSLNADGSFTYSPQSTFIGTDTFVYTIKNTAVSSTDTATVSINVADTSAIQINEVLFNPPGTDAPNEYIELRGTPSVTIPAGTYLVAIEGDSADNPGDVQTIINLSGLSFGSNGFLVLLQQGNTYTTAAGATVVTSATTGFGGLPGSIWSADSAATDIEDASVTFMLIQSGVAPTLTDDIDSNDDGTADGNVFGGWGIRDSIGVLDGTSTSDRAYGAMNYSNNTGTNGSATGTTVLTSFTAGYVGRRGDTSGATAADWVASGALGGAAPNWTLGVATETEPASFAGKPLNHIGASNFANLAPVNTVPGAQSTNEDTPFVFTGATQISIADSDAGSNDLKVTLTAVNGSFSLSGTGGLTFSTGDGTSDPQMVFTGTLTNINSALNNLTFTPTLNFFSPPVASLTILTEDQGNTGVGGNKTDTDTVNLTVNAINDAPTLDALGNLTIAEDATAQTVNLSGITAGPGESQTLTVTAVSNNTGIIPNPTVTYTSPNSTGSLSFTPVANANGGPVTITVTVMDNGGTLSGGVDSFQRQFTVTVTEVNDAPVATDDTLSDILEDASPVTIPFGTLVGNDNKGAANESAQTLTITAVGTAVGGTVQIVGTDVIFTPTPNFNGPASFEYTVQDNGTTNGSADPKTDTGAASFNITAVNDPPSFTKGADQTVNIDAGPQTVPGWATGMSQGPGESGQTPLVFNVTQTGGTVTFSSAPAIDSTTGNLTYTANIGSSGTATFNVSLSDSGPNAPPPNSNTSAVQSFTINVVPTLALVVNDSGDDADNNLGDKICDAKPAAGNQCTLRAAIQETNAAATPDSIDFSLSANTTITLLSALDDINGDLVITGPASGVTVNGNNLNRVFTVLAGKTVSILNLTMANGRANQGGGIFNSGNLTISNSTISGNNAVGGTAEGGAIYSNSGTLTILNSTISGNTANGSGGGLFNGGTSTATLVNVTVTNNRTDADGGAPGPGGGIAQSSSNPVTLRNTIVAGNFTGVAPGTAPDEISGTMAAGSNNNLIGAAGFGGLTNGVNFNQVGVSDARLAALANNGGPTQTHALLAGSAALDAGDNTTATNASLTTDQRGPGFIRAADGPDADATATVDIGAFEAQVWVQDILDRSIAEDSSDSFSFNVGGAAAVTTVTATSSNTALVPNNVANLNVSGSGSTRTLTINPVANGNGSTVITVTVNSASGSMTDTFVFTVWEVNDAPTANNDTIANSAEDSGPRTILASTLISNDSKGPANESGQTLIIKTVGSAVGGTVSIVSGNVVFTPTADYNGPASFQYTVEDNGTTNVAAAPLTSGPATVSFNITEVNDAPDAVDDGLSTVAEDSGMRTITIASLLANDSKGPANESGQTLTLTGVSNPVGGTVTSDATNVYFTPAADFNGTASFQYTITDNGTTNGAADPKSDTATVSFTITEVNDSPIPENDPLATLAEDAPQRTIPFSALTGNDSRGAANESGQTLIVKTVSNPVGLTVSIVAGTVRFTPLPDYNGPASFRYTVEDNGTTNGAPDPKTSATSALVHFNITEVNDVPTAVNDTLPSIPEDSGPQTIPFSTLTANDLKGPANESSQTLIVKTVSNPVGGTVSIVAGDVVFTPTPNFNGVSSFDYTVEDNGTTDGVADPKTSSTATVTFANSAVADTPSVTNATTNANTQTTSGLVISRNPADGAEVTHFKITNITGGSLFKNDGVTPINNGDFITFAEGNAGLKFTPGTVNGSFTVQASLSASDAGLGGGTVIATIIVNPLGGVIRFSSATYSVAEGAGFRTITVERSGDTSQAVTVDYASSDHSNPADFVPCTAAGAGQASSRCDFTTALGTLRFAAGETSKTFNVLITNDNYVEGPETLDLTLSNPSGGAVLGVPSTAVLSILDDAAEPATNPIDNAADFVRAQYHDVLNREPDAAGLASWTDNIEKCNDSNRRPAGQTVAQCIDKQRESTAIAFFMSPEFHMTGGFVYHLYKGSLTGTPNYDSGSPNSSPGRFPTFLEFMRDMGQVSEGIVVNGQISGAVVEANRNALATAFVQRPEFVAKYGGLNNTLYVEELFNTTGIVATAAQKQALVDGLTNATETRASVLRKVVDGTVVISESNVQFTTPYGQAFINQENRRLFVYLEYVGYLRRNPDTAGFVFWLGKLNSFNGNPFQAEMVRSFILSPEYRSRFGQP